MISHCSPSCFPLRCCSPGRSLASTEGKNPLGKTWLVLLLQVSDRCDLLPIVCNRWVLLTANLLRSLLAVRWPSLWSRFCKKMLLLIGTERVHFCSIVSNHQKTCKVDFQSWIPPFSNGNLSLFFFLFFRTFRFYASPFVFICVRRAISLWFPVCFRKTSHCLNHLRAGSCNKGQELQTSCLFFRCITILDTDFKT